MHPHHNSTLRRSRRRANVGSTNCKTNCCPLSVGGERNVRTFGRTEHRVTHLSTNKCTNDSLADERANYGAPNPKSDATHCLAVARTERCECHLCAKHGAEQCAHRSADHRAHSVANECGYDAAHARVMARFYRGQGSAGNARGDRESLVGSDRNRAR